QLTQRVIPDAARVDLQTDLLLKPLGDLLRGDGAKQLAALAGLDREVQRQPLDLLGDLLHAALKLGAALGGVGAQRFQLLQRARRGLHSKLLRDEVVTGKTGRHIDDVASDALVVNIFKQDDLHSTSLSLSRIITTANVTLFSGSHQKQCAGPGVNPTPADHRRRGGIILRGSMNPLLTCSSRLWVFLPLTKGGVNTPRTYHSLRLARGREGLAPLRVIRDQLFPFQPQRFEVGFGLVVRLAEPRHLVDLALLAGGGQRPAKV